MREPRHVREDEFLILDIDVIDIVAVDDKASANPDELETFRAKLFPYHTLHLTQLESQHPRLIVRLNQVAVIPVRRNKHNPFGRNAHQVSRCGYDQILLQHDEAKVATPSECKVIIFVEMYEIGRKMYEIVFSSSSPAGWCIPPAANTTNPEGGWLKNRFIPKKHANSQQNDTSIFIYF